ncbi:hypothetical protein GCM10011348_40820 [Marinobacterium nitratireducens]|uniref:Copper chaperone PCu(A)C n=1 Tax=Marinobacterium nitratireducens TaxID=518897 RepID=A0A917ZQ03_9GAMM|nr:copper chaperone PCu(A)C [Marinobacterium nitratireducens]GGO87495.1 hypothetical protein GCM10011348_40820 [Marinobacterium nitratireducens]
MPSFSRFAAPLLASLLCVAGPALAEVTVSDAYARAVPPGQSNSAAFLVIRNDADEAVRLIDAASDSAGVVELHTHSEQDGVLKMRRIDAIEIPGRGEHSLAPGADHLMLIGLTRVLSEGDSIGLSLEFSDGQRLQLDVPVKSIMATMQGMQNGHQHHAE